MKAGELRIGNILKQGVITYLEMNNTELIYLRCGGSYVEQPDPEPITEEWLLKFGFEKEAGREGYYWEHQSFRLGEAGSYFIPYGIDDYKSVSVATVHQLQNLYFALTGEELTIK